MQIEYWTYEADIHCNTCAEHRFGDYALNENLAVDKEGNKVHPKFSTDDDPDYLPIVCSTCGTIIKP